MKYQVLMTQYLRVEMYCPLCGILSNMRGVADHFDNDFD